MKHLLHITEPQCSRNQQLNSWTSGMPKAEGFAYLRDAVKGNQESE